MIWLPDYFKKTRGLDIKHSWAHPVLIYAIVTVLSIIGGRLTGSLTRRGYSVTRARRRGLFVLVIGLFPLYTGKPLDRFQAAGNITAGYTMLFAVCGPDYLLAFAIHYVLAPKLDPIAF